jgi:SAM-dependent methyltransferase
LKSRRQLPSAEIFDQISRYWAEIADANATRKQVDFVKSNVNHDGLILDLGCGNGRHDVLLNKASYEVVGLDISKKLLQLAKIKAANANANPFWVRADMRFLPFRSGVFAAVISLDTSFGYLPSELEDVETALEVFRVLSEKGVFLLDVFNRERMLQRHGPKTNFGLKSFVLSVLPRVPQFARLFKWREYPSFYLLQKRALIQKGKKLWDLWLFRDKNTQKIIVSNHVVRLYSPMQMQTILRKAGFQSLSLQGNYEGQEYTKDSSKLIVIARKN